MKSVNMDRIKNNLIKQEEKKNKKGGDPRFLNYFDMETSQQMVIRLLPDGGDSGELWLEYSTHGPNLKNGLVDNIACANMNDERCPACTYSYGLWSNDEKEEAKKWRNKTTYVAQCIVIDSPIEVNQAEDGNMIKLMYVPYGMLEVIKESIINGTVEDPTAVDFVIKKTKNAGGFAAYDKSFFKQADKSSDIPVEVLESIDSGTSYLNDLSELLPERATAAQVQEWLDKARVIVEGGEPGNEADTPSEPVAPVSSKSATTAAVEEETSDKPPRAQDLMAKLKERNRN